MTAIPELTTVQAFTKFINGDGLRVVHFSVSWNSSCPQVNEILIELQKEFGKNFVAAQVNADELAQLAESNNITSAPTVIFFRSGKLVDRVIGFDENALKTLALKHSMAGVPAGGASDLVVKESLEEHLERLINKSRFVVFMKGAPEQPRCGFSRQLVEILNGLNADYSTFDILNDEEVRQGLKEYSDWPTYPQIYLDGTFIGGLDVLREEIKDPEFVEKLPKRN